MDNISYCDSLTQALNSFFVWLLKQTFTWNFFVHSGFVPKIHCSALDRCAACQSVSEWVCCWSVLPYKIMFIHLIIISVSVLFILKMYSALLITLIQVKKTITGKLKCCKSLQEVNISVSHFGDHSAFCWHFWEMQRVYFSASSSSISAHFCSQRTCIKRLLCLEILPTFLYIII